MKLTIYEYSKCGTCRKALKLLKDNGVDVERIPLFEQPPSAEELTTMIQQSGLDIKKFFNTSGEVYREMNLKTKLSSMSDEEKIQLLASNGRLIKRPIVTDGQKVTVGFNEEAMTEAWL